MISVNPFWIIILASYVSLFVAFLILTNVYSLISKKFNILQYFPYEILSQKNPLLLIGKVCLYGFAIPSFLPIILILIYKESFGSLLYLEICISMVTLFSSLVNVIVSQIPVEHTKPHNIITTIQLSVSFLLSALVSFNGYYFFFLHNEHSTGSPLHLVLAIVSTVITLVMLFIMFNPMLKHWYQLEKVTSESGEVTIKRPKVFILAFSEWLSIILAFVSGLLFIIELIKI